MTIRVSLDFAIEEQEFGEFAKEMSGYPDGVIVTVQ